MEQQIQLRRVRLTREELEHLSKAELIERWMQQENYINLIEARAHENSNESLELVSLRESEEKLKQQQLEATRRENILVMRLTTKEQEMQDYANQIQELKQAQVPSLTQLRSALLDPAVNLLFERMRKELESTKARLEETQNELSAWKFTPDSNTGKRLMAKCRQLYQENEELGKMISSGRIATLEGDLALQKKFTEEMKKTQSELDEFLLELDEDVEGMQSTIYYLQQQLRESKEQIAHLQQEVQKLSNRSRTPSNHMMRENETNQYCYPNSVEQMPIEMDEPPDKPFVSSPDGRPFAPVTSNGHHNVISDSKATPSPLSEEDSPPSFEENVRTDMGVGKYRVPSPEGNSNQLLKGGLRIVTSGNESEAVGHSKFPRETSVRDTTIESCSSQCSQPVLPEDTAKSQDSIVSQSSDVLALDVSSVEEDVCIDDIQTCRGKVIVQRTSMSPSTSPERESKRTKRTLTNSPPNPEATESMDSLQSPKRRKPSNESTEDSTEAFAGQNSVVEIDTDTEVQVAETLACWPVSSKELQQLHMRTQEPPLVCIRNGQLTEMGSPSCISDDEV